MTCMRAQMSSKFGAIPPPTAELAALYRWNKSPYTHNGKNGVATFYQLFLIGSFSYLQVIMSYIRAWMCLKFGQIRPRTTGLAALECLKNHCCHYLLIAIYLIHFKFVGIEDIHNI